MDRGELGTFLFTAERFDHAHAVLAVLLGLNGLRLSEAWLAVADRNYLLTPKPFKSERVKDISFP